MRRAIAGCKLVICADNQAERICRLFNEEGVTHSAGVPTVWLNVIDHVEDTGAELGKLHTSSSAARRRRRRRSAGSASAASASAICGA